MKKLNQDLYDQLNGSILYLLEYSDKNNIILPNRERLLKLIENIHFITNNIKEHYRKINNFSAKHKHPSTTPEDSTEPIFM